MRDPVTDSAFVLSRGERYREYCFGGGEDGARCSTCRDALDEREADLAAGSRSVGAFEFLCDRTAESTRGIEAVGVLDDSTADLDLAENACGWSDCLRVFNWLR